MKNKKGGSSNGVWVSNVTKFGNIDWLEHQNSVKKINSNSDREIEGLEQLFDLTNEKKALNMNAYRKNTNRKAIDDAMRTLEDTESLANALMGLKERLNKEIRAMKSKDLQSLRIDQFYYYLQHGENEEQFIVNNDKVTVGGSELTNPEYATKQIIGYAKKQGELDEDKGRLLSQGNITEDDWGKLDLSDRSRLLKHSEIVNSLDREGDAVSLSIRSMLGWREVDLSKYAMGSMVDFVNITLHLLNAENGKELTFKDSPYNLFIEIGAPFYHDDDISLIQFLDRKTLLVPFGSGKKIGSRDTFIKRLMMPGDEDVVKTKENEDIKEILTNMQETLRGKVRKNSKEYLYTLLYAIFEHSTLTYTQVVDAFKIGGIKGEVIDGMKQSIDGMTKVWKSALAKYFNVDIKYDYGVVKGTRDTGLVDPTDSKWVFRVLGGEKAIRAENKLTERQYPLVLKEGRVLDIPASKKSLVKILSSVIIDAKSGKEITVGGVVPKVQIAMAAVQLVQRFFKQNVVIKEHNLKRIDEILTKMKSGLRVKYLRNTKNRMSRLYRTIAEEYEAELKDLRASAVINQIVNGYQDVKNAELDKVISIYRILKLIKDDKNRLATNVEALEQLKYQRERIVIELSQTQLKGIAYKDIALNLYRDLVGELQREYNLKAARRESKILGTELVSEALPMKYYEVLKERLDQMDKDYTEKIGEIVHSHSNLEGVNTKLIVGALNSGKQYHPEFWNRIFSSNDGTNSSANVGKKAKISNAKLTAMMNSMSLDQKNNEVGKKEIDPTADLSNNDRKIVSQKFWLDVRERLQGKTIYIPFVRTRAVLPDQHGIFDLLEACIRGRISKELFIYGSNLTEEVLSRSIVVRGKIMVCGTNGNKERPSRWRLFLMEELALFSKMSENDMRLHFYKTLADETVYNKRASMYWTENSETREKLLKYCRTLTSYMECPLLASREEIAKKLNGVDQIEFKGGAKRCNRRVIGRK